MLKHEVASKAGPQKCREKALKVGVAGAERFAATAPRSILDVHGEKQRQERQNILGDVCALRRRVTGVVIRAHARAADAVHEARVLWAWDLHFEAERHAVALA